MDMELLYLDEQIVVCIKPARVLSTDEPGGLPELLRRELGEPNGDIRTVHRLDRVVSGVMVLARSAAAAAELSRQVRENALEKEYLAIVHGTPSVSQGTMRDLMYRDKARKMSFVTNVPGKGVQEALLRYQDAGQYGNLTRVRIRLQTGRTHQIRVQFASRGMPLAGERKYASLEDPWDLALWSRQLRFRHPETGQILTFRQEPPDSSPWSLFPDPAATETF